MQNSIITTIPKTLEYYKGILIHADTHLHEQAFWLIKKYVSQDNTIVDIGAGAGAFCQRLFDYGYDVTGVDIDKEKWIPKAIPFLQLNIDQGIQKYVNRQFDVACCFEVIEHVENPWNLMREIRSIVKPGGLLLLSTPNITSFLSRQNFLLKGKFHQFEDSDLDYGHISPITVYELLHIAKNTGWQALEISPGGYLPIFDLSILSPKKLILNLLRGLTYLTARGYKNGWSLFFVLRRIDSVRV